MRRSSPQRHSMPIGSATMFSRSEQEALVAALPVASLKVYRETGHAPHWERPKDVVRDLERFLRTALS